MRKIIESQIKYYIILPFLLLSGYIIYNVNNIETNIAIYSLSIYTILLVVSVMLSWKKICGTYFDAYLLFYWSALLFNSGQIILAIFDKRDNIILGETFKNNELISAVFLTDLALTILHLAALISSYTNSKKNRNDSEANNTYVFTGKEDVVGWGMLFVSIIPASIIIYEKLQVVFSVGYIGLFRQNAGTGIMATPQILAGFITPSIMFLIAGKRKLSALKIGALVIFVTYCVLNLYLGYRYIGLAPLIAMLWLWDKTRSKINRKYLLIGILVIVFTMPIIGVLRKASGSNRITIENIMHSYNSIDNPIKMILYEMGNSFQATLYTMKMVPQIRDYDYGIGYAYASTTIIPNIFGKVHPAYERETLATWLTKTVAPAIWRNGGGMGFTFIAEAYISGGYIAVVIIMAIIGYFYGKLTLWPAITKDPYKYAVVASFMSSFLFFPRSESVIIARSLLWYSLLPYLIIMIIRKKC